MAKHLKCKGKDTAVKQIVVVSEVYIILQFCINLINTCLIQSVEEGLVIAKGYSNPYLLLTGTLQETRSIVIVCGKVVVTTLEQSSMQL